MATTNPTPTVTAATSNPANAPATRKVEPDFIPMSIPTQKLAVPEIPGYHLHWMQGTAARLQQALRAKYEFVTDDEVGVANFDLAGAAAASGSSDLGSRISVVAGATSEGGQPIRLYLMKQKQEYRDRTIAMEEANNDRIVEALRGGGLRSPHDDSNRYAQERNRNIFSKRRA